MGQTLKTAMMSSTSEVLETMFFVSIEFEEHPSSDLQSIRVEKPIACRLGFTSSFSGAFYLMIPSGLLAELSAGFMGLEPEEVSNSEMIGTIKEMTNMIAGNTFSKMPEADSFQLGIPEIIDAAARYDFLAESTETLEVNTPQGAFSFHLQIEKS